MKNKKRIVLIILTLIIAIGIGSGYVYDKYYNYNKQITYHLCALKLDRMAVNTYPQRITKELSRTPFYELNLVVNADKKNISEAILGDYDYPKDVLKYVEPTELIQSEVEAIKKLSNDLFGNEKKLSELIAKVAKWTSENIEFDYHYASRTFYGYEDKQSAVETLNTKIGASGQYSNLFIAIMRAKNIPAKYVIGHKFGMRTCAWAEVYINHIGWVSVDPSQGTYNLDTRYVKLFEGKDFVDCKINLWEIGAGIERIY